MTRGSVDRTAAADGRAPGPEHIARRVLPSGLTLLCCRTGSAQYVEMLLRVPAGSRWDPDGLGGLAEYAAKGLLYGTRRLGFDKYNEALDRLGASLSAECGPDAALLRGSCLAGDLRGFSALFSEALLEPSFAAADMERLRAELLTRISERDQDTARLAGRLAIELAYPPGHPYGRPPLGLVDSVERITGGELAGFHASRYTPAGAVLAVVGPLEPEETLDALVPALRGWQPARSAETEAAAQAPRADGAGRACGNGAAGPAGGTLCPSPAADGGWPGPRTEVELPGKTQTDLALALPSVPRRAPEFEKLYVLNLVLGGLGLGGRLARRVREELGLAYYCFSTIVERQEAGPWLLQVGTNRSNVELALRTIGEELRRIRTCPVTADELEDAVGFACGSLTLQLESPAGLAEWLVRIEAYGLGPGYLREYPERLRSLEPADLLPVAQRILEPARTALAVVGPGAGGARAGGAGGFGGFVSRD